MKKRLLALVMIAALLIGALASCSTPGGGGDGGSDTGEKVFRYATNTEPTTFDLTKGNSIGDNEIQHAITEGLTRNTGGVVTPGIAESWDISEDGLVYTFHLREAYWSDGQPITAQDFVYSWQRLIDPATGSPYSWFLDTIGIKNAAKVEAGELDPSELGIKAIDDRTLEVTLDRPMAVLLSGLGMQSNLGPVRQDMVEKYGAEFAATADKNVYSGPYVLTSTENNVYVFEKNPNYWDADNVKLDRVELNYIEKADTALAMYENGELDYVRLDNAVVENYKDREDCHSYLNGNVDYCYINTESENPVWKNQNFRLALNYALDREEYNQLANSGVYHPYNALCFPGLTGKDGKTYGETYDVDSYAYPINGDVDLAKEYLGKAMDELGIASPSDITIEFVTTDAESNKKIAEVLQERWQSTLGINVKIRQVTYSQIYGEVYPNFDYEIGYAGWGPDFDDPTTYLNLWRSDVKWYNPYSNPEFDAKLDAAQAEVDDPNARMDLLNEAEQILIADGAWVPLQARQQYYLLSPKMKDVTFYSFSINIDWAFADIAE
ncbi:MAG: peptide ABC transporter substrate-binding protein [Mogibacterium sp.]|nr:peptide ABC transporter substrate-binding protein [Mogibacterium sp.]